MFALEELFYKYSELQVIFDFGYLLDLERARTFETKTQSEF